MATVSLNLDISANGLKGLVELSSQFNKNMQEGAAAANASSKPISGGTAGSRAVSNSAATPQASYASYKAENQDYNLQRSVGGTGSSASDFARQSQGLGGLVHLYATFAANLFAAEAAFRALSEAMNTMHLQQGLDQLGAQSGKSLGTLSKNLTDATDGALSFKQAMTATVTASAAGLTSAQILKMGEVAKKASQALGLDMADSMARLTSSIEKGRPAVLAQLGIFLNANTVYSNYAISIGKTANALTDYEKKQAFANAVLKQGIDKFGAIDIPTNPFSKLEAAMTNITQTALGFVDRVLGPIVDILATSPTGLATAMALVAATLVGKALPAVAAFKENANAAAEAAKNIAKSKAEAANEAFKSELTAQVSATKVKNDLVLAERDKEIANTKAHYDSLTAIETEKVEKATAAITALREKAFKPGSATAKLLDPQLDPLSITEKQLTSVQGVGKRFETQGNAELAAQYKSVVEGLVAVRDRTVDAIFTQAQQEKESKEVAATQQKVADQQIENNNKLIESNKSKYTIAGRLQVEADRAEAASVSRGIVANAAQIASTQGFVAAIKATRAEIIKSRTAADNFSDVGPKIPTSTVNSTSALGEAWTGVKSGVSAATTAVSGFLSFAGPWLQIIGLATAGLSALDTLLSSAAKEQGTFNKSTESSVAALKTASDAVEYLGTKSKNIFSAEGINAMSNAISGINDALDMQLTAYDKLQAKQNGYEKAWDSFWHLFGKGNMDSIVDSISKDIPAALNTMLLSSKYDDAKKKFAGILKLNPSDLNPEAIKKALDSLSKTEAPEVIKQIKDAFYSVTEAEKSSTAALADFSSTLTSIDKELDTIDAKIQFKDGAGKMGSLLQEEAIKLGRIIEDNPVKALSSFIELSSNVKNISLLPQNVADQLIKDKFAADKLKLAYDDIVKSIIKTDEAIAKSKAEGSYKDTNISDAFGNTQVESGKGAGLEAQKKAQEVSLSTAQVSIAKFVREQSALVEVIYSEGAKQIGLGLKNAIEEADLTKAKADLSIFSAAGLSTAQKSYDLTIRDLEMQKKVLENAYNHEIAVIKNTEQMALLTAGVAAEKASRDIQTNKAILAPDSKATEVEKTTAKSAGEDAALALKNATITANTIKYAMALRGEGVLPANDILASSRSGTGPNVSSARLQNQEYDKVKAQLQASSAKINSQEYAALDVKQLALLKDQTASKQEQLKLDQEENTLELQRITNLDSITGTYNEQLADRRQVADMIKIEQTYDAVEIANTEHLAEIALARSKNAAAMLLSHESGKNATSDELDAREKIYKKELDQAKLAKEGSLITLSRARATKDIAEALKETTRLNTNFNAIEQDNTNLSTQRISNQEQELSNALALGKLDDKTYNQRKLDFDLAKQELAYKTQSNTAEQALAAAKVVTKQKSATATEYGGLFGTSEELSKAQDAQAIAEHRVNTLREENGLKIDSAKATKAQNDALAEQKDHLADIALYGTNLTTVFGNVGTAMGSLVAALDNYFTASQKGSDRELAAQKALDEARKTSAEAEYSGSSQKQEEAKKAELATEKNLATVKSRNAAEELSNISKVFGASKSMFDQKSSAYKIMDGIEKVSAASSLAIQVGTYVKKAAIWAEEAATKIATMVMGEAGATAATEAGAAARTPTYIEQIYASWGALGPWMVGAAALFIASTLGGGGGIQPPAIDQGTLAGTGQQVGADGQTIGTRAGGVVGDPKAQAKSITDSIADLSKVFFGVMGSNSSSLLKHLQGIQDNTFSTAKALGGIGTLGSNNPFNAVVSSSKAFSTGIGILDNIAGSIFGGGTSQSITGSGIQVAGTSSQLAGGTGTLRGYTNIHSETAGSLLGGGGSSSDNTVYSGLDKSITKGIQGIFQNFNATLLDTADNLGKSKDEISKILDTTSLTLSVSNAGLTGTEFANKLSAEVSVQLNAIAEKAYPFLDLYTKVGEESFQTATRLIKDSETVTQGLNLMGLSFNKLSFASDLVETRIAKQQQIIQNFGGTADLYAAAIQAYYDSMFTASEKAAFGAKSVAQQLNDLNVTGVSTSVQLRALIETLDPTTQIYADLVKLAPAMVAAEQATAALVNTLESSRLDQSISVMNLLGKAEDSLALQRKKELAGIDPLLVNNQNYIYALQDEATVRGNLNTAINATITSLKTSISTLETYKTTLTLGTLSTLDPTQKYQQTKQSLADLEAIISKTPLNTTDQAAQDAAIAKFPAASDSFLNASKVLFASSAQYQQDFKTVSDFVTISTNVLTTQQTDAEKQLQQLTDSATSLGIISTTLDSIDTLLVKYVDAYNKVQATSGTTTLTPIPAHANGGIALGVSLVGERGPELVDFATPSRVYSNSATKGLLNNDATVAELKSLSSGIAQLIQTQQTQANTEKQLEVLVGSANSLSTIASTTKNTTSLLQAIVAQSQVKDTISITVPEQVDTTKQLKELTNSVNSLNSVVNITKNTTSTITPVSNKVNDIIPVPKQLDNEKHLKVLVNSDTLLNSIVVNTKNITDLLSQYISMYSKVKTISTNNVINTIIPEQTDSEKHLKVLSDSNISLGIISTTLRSINDSMLQKVSTSNKVKDNTVVTVVPQQIDDKQLKALTTNNTSLSTITNILNNINASILQSYSKVKNVPANVTVNTTVPEQLDSEKYLKVISDSNISLGIISTTLKSINDLMLQNVSTSSKVKDNTIVTLVPQQIDDKQNKLLINNTTVLNSIVVDTKNIAANLLQFISSFTKVKSVPINNSVTATVVTEQTDSEKQFKTLINTLNSLESISTTLKSINDLMVQNVSRSNKVKDNTIVTLIPTQTDNEKQLKILTNSNNSLVNIATNIKNTTNLLQSISAYNKVKNVPINTTVTALIPEQTDTEKQLKLLTNTANYLNTIVDTTKGMVSLLEDIAIANKIKDTSSASTASITSIPAHADGGVATGISLVGEKGPELVDFSTPSRVYSNKDSSDMFNTDELVAELKALRKEVSQLRAEQKEQTGHIISTNYEATIKAATTVANATEEAAVTVGWNSRSAPILP